MDELKRDTIKENNFIYHFRLNTVNPHRVFHSRDVKKLGTASSATIELRRTAGTKVEELYRWGKYPTTFELRCMVRPKVRTMRVSNRAALKPSLLRGSGAY